MCICTCICIWRSEANFVRVVGTVCSYARRLERVVWMRSRNVTYTCSPHACSCVCAYACIYTCVHVCCAHVCKTPRFDSTVKHLPTCSLEFPATLGALVRSGSFSLTNFCLQFKKTDSLKACSGRGTKIWCRASRMLQTTRKPLSRAWQASCASVRMCFTPL